MKPLPYQLFSVLAVILLTSCGGKDKDKDPHLTKKSADQQSEIARLRSELALLDEQLKILPPDRSAELLEARKTADAQVADLAKLEVEISKLQARKAQLTKEFDEYKRKYAIR